MNGLVIMGLLILFGIAVYQRDWIQEKAKNGLDRLVGFVVRKTTFASAPAVTRDSVTPMTVCDALNEMGRDVDRIDWAT